MRYSRSKSVVQNLNLPMEPLSDKELLKNILAGVCSKETLRVCRIENLEHLIFKIIGMHTATNAHTDLMPETKPSWWSDDVLSFFDLQNVQRKVHQVIQDWHNMLITVLDSCTQYYRNSTSKPLKEVSDTPSEIPPKMLLKMASNKALDLAITPVKILPNVLKAQFPILEKDAYMDFLKLQPIESLPSTPIETAPINLRCKYSTKLPFSSISGRKAIAKDRYTCSKKYQRKLDWTNSYLAKQDDNGKKPFKKKFKVIYTPKKSASTYEHRYIFPQRQQRQRKNALEALKRTFFKPVTVRLKRLNIQPYLMKMKMCRQCSVNIDKTETDQTILNILSSSVTFK